MPIYLSSQRLHRPEMSPSYLFVRLSQVGIQSLQIHQRDLVLLGLGLGGFSKTRTGKAISASRFTNIEETL